MEGIIFKALSGFYYVEGDDGAMRCRGRGKFRLEGITPLVGDRVRYKAAGGGDGVLEEILPRRNAFVRPPVANIDQMVIIASAVNPVTDPFLIDRIAAIAETNSCQPVICINKADISHGDALYDIYDKTGITVIHTSAATGEGLDKLRETIKGKINAFTGNSGVGKSSILNALEPDFDIKVGDVSDKLGRGRHTTRHIELYKLSFGAIVADTPGFSSFDTERMELTDPRGLQHAFREFGPYMGKCRFNDCAHVKETGCAILEAVSAGEIHPSRHESYVRLYEQVSRLNQWEIK